jgi:hypothetical protein
MGELTMFDDFDTQVQCEELCGEEPYMDDEEDLLDTQEMDAINDDGDILNDDDENELIDENGGITADGFALLADMDAQGYFV